MLAAIARDYGAEVVTAYMDHVLANAEESVRRMLGSLEDGAFTYAMDNGGQVTVAIRVDRAARSAVFDFTGTSPQRPDNFNAPRAIARADLHVALQPDLIQLDRFVEAWFAPDAQNALQALVARLGK